MKSIIAEFKKTANLSLWYLSTKIPNMLERRGGSKSIDGRVEAAKRKLETFVAEGSVPPKLIDQFNSVRFGELTNPSIKDKDILDSILDGRVTDATFYIQERLAGPVRRRYRQV